MRESTTLLAGMALSALVLIGLTVTSDKSTASFTATTTNPGNQFGSATLTMSNVALSNTGNLGFTFTATQLAGASR